MPPVTRLQSLKASSLIPPMLVLGSRKHPVDCFDGQEDSGSFIPLDGIEGFGTDGGRGGHGQAKSLAVADPLGRADFHHAMRTDRARPCLPARPVA